MPTWSGIRAKLEQDCLAPSLKGRIQYFATTYSKCPDHEGRASVRLDGKEILKSSYYEYCMAEWNTRYALAGRRPDLPREHLYRLSYLETLEGGDFDQRDFYHAFQEFDNQSIEASLESPNPIVRLFALLDRRTGKRRLAAMKDTMEQEPEWLRYFYYLRLDAEGMQLNTLEGK